MGDSMIENLYLVATVGEARIAFRSAEVESVVVVRNVTPVPAAPPHIIGLFALRSRVMTLVDAGIAVGESGSGSPEGRKTVVTDCGGHAYGIIVDQVEDVVFIEEDEFPIRGQLSPGWERVAESMIDHDGHTLLVVSAEALVQGQARLRAA